MLPFDKALGMIEKDGITALDITVLMQVQWILHLSDNPALLPEYEKYLNSEYDTMRALGYKQNRESKESYVKFFVDLARDNLNALNAKNN